MGLFSNKNKRKSRFNSDAVDIFRMKSTVEDIIKAHLASNPQTTQARVLNDIHYEIGRGKYDVQAERELLETMSGSERDNWYQRLLAPFDVNRGLLMDSARTDESKNLGNYTMEITDNDPKAQYPTTFDVKVIAKDDGSVVLEKKNIKSQELTEIESKYYNMDALTDGEVQTLQKNFREIVEFFERTGATPKKDKTNPVEYQLGARLEALRSQPDKAKALAGMDSHGLLTRSDSNRKDNGQVVATKYYPFAKAEGIYFKTLEYMGKNSEGYDVYNMYQGMMDKQANIIEKSIYQEETYRSYTKDASQIAREWENSSLGSGGETNFRPALEKWNKKFNNDSKGTQMKNTLKQDGNTYLLKTDAYEKRFDSEVSAKLFAKRHHLTLDADEPKDEDKKPKDEPKEKKEDDELDEDGNPIKKEKKSNNDSLSSDISSLKSGTENLIQYVNGQDLTKVRKIQTILGEIQTSAEKYNEDTVSTRSDYFESKQSLISELEGALEYLNRLKIEVVSKPNLGGELAWQKKYVEDLKREIANWDSADIRTDSARLDVAQMATRIKIAKSMGRFDSAERKDEDYNGYRNYATWNVSLWIANDYGLYQMAQEYKKEGGSTYLGFVEYAGLSGTTPDGESWTGADLDYMTLDSEIRDI